MITAVAAFALCLASAYVLANAAQWPRLAAGALFVASMALASTGAIFMKTLLSDFEETWTFSEAGVSLTSRTLFGRNERVWPLQKADIRVQPEGTPLCYNLLVRSGSGEWMMVFSFEDKHLAARTAERIEVLIAAAV